MIVLSISDAEQLRAFERQGHDALAATYDEFFAAVTAMAIEPLVNAVGLRPGMHLLDVVTGPDALAAVPEIIEDGLTGLVVEGKEEAVAATDRLSGLSRRAIRQRFEDRFTARRMAREYLMVYCSLIEKRHTDSFLDGVHTT
jgi:glycosyltransferase involved in cell wall biosynthesis